MRKEENVYYIARMDAAKRDERLRSREYTAERLGLSTATLANYELGVTKIVPPDAVVMMADLYNAPELLYYYCANECPIGQKLPLPTNHCRLDAITGKALKALSMHIVEKAKDQMVDIMTDGMMHERSTLTITDLLGYIDGLVKTLYELRLAYHKMLADDGKKIW